MSKRFLLIGALVALFPFVFPTNSSAQYRRGPVHRVVVVNSFASPFWYDDPWFYDMQWGGGYGPYGPYGPYHRYVAADSSVKLEVKPKQAEVYVDGYYAGIVDDFNGTFQRLHVAPGEHEIELYLDGYRTVRQKVYLTPDNTFKLKYEMERLAAGEQPEARPQPIGPPAGAQPPVYQQPPPHQGRRAPQQPPQPPPPPPGVPGDPRGAGVSAYGSLAVRVQPGDADVLVDGEKWHAPDGQERVVIELPEGRHTVEIQKSGYRTYVTDVDVHRGETTPLNVSLRSQEDQ